MRNNKKGFTLIELLVCITILGIIMAMSIPVIRNLTVKNAGTKYASYLDTVVNAAKLYVDSYGDDMFGHYESGCDYVTFEDLKDKNLVKDYNADGITCDTTSTFVEVSKYKDSYSYKGFLGCARKSDPSELIYTLPNNGTPNEQDPATCAGIDITTTIGVLAEPNSYTLLDENSLNVKIKINGRSGIARDSLVRYKWSTSNVDFSPDGMQDAIINYPTNAAQRLDMNAGNMISAESSLISTPLGESGKLYLIIYSENLRDLYDNLWSYNELNYVAFGPFTIDNKAPVFDGTSNVVSSKASYNCDVPRLSISVTDDVTPTSDLKMCVSYSGFCTDWEDFNATKKLDSITGFQYDGSTYKVYVSVKDLADNVANKEFSYKSYVHCSSTTPDGSWVGDCPVCGTNVKISQTRKMKDTYLGTSCPDSTQVYTCSIPACCSSTKMECTDWGEYGACSKECCIGTMKRTRTCNNISNYDGSFCSAVTNTSDLVQTAECNHQACASYMYHENIVGLSSYTCDSEDPYKGTRNCTLYWGSSNNLNLSWSVYRSPVYGDGKWFEYAKYNNSSTPYCNWVTNDECSGFPVPGIFLLRYDQKSDYSLKGGIATFNMYGVAEYPI